MRGLTEDVTDALEKEDKIVTTSGKQRRRVARAQQAYRLKWHGRESRERDSIVMQYDLSAREQFALRNEERQDA